MKKKVIAASVLSIGLLGGITTLAHADETWYCDNHEGYATCGGSMHDAIHHEERSYNNGVHHDETDNTYNNTSTYYNEMHENAEQCNNSCIHHDENYNGTNAHHGKMHGNAEHSHGSCHR